MFTEYIGQRVTIFCGIYIYTGKVERETGSYVELSNAAIVYETGPLDTVTWADAQPLPHNWRVALQSIESFGILKA